MGFELVKNAQGKGSSFVEAPIKLRPERDIKVTWVRRDEQRQKTDCAKALQ